MLLKNTLFIHPGLKSNHTWVHFCTDSKIKSESTVERIQTTVAFLNKPVDPNEWFE